MVRSFRPPTRFSDPIHDLVYHQICLSVVNRIPAHIAWPGAVIGLIVLGMVSTFGVLIASRSDGGPQVVDRYYQQAVAWDSTAALRQASRDLGWTVDVTRMVVDGRTALDVRVTDRDGHAVTGLTGALLLRRPQSAGVLERLPLALGAPATSTNPATPLRAFPSVSGRGLWDVDVELQRGKTRFVGSVRREWRLP